MTKQVSTATIYLGTPFYNDDQRARVKKAMALLEKNPTVVRVHFPFDQNFVDPEEKNPEIGGIRSMTWRLATYNNDITGLVNASCGVFLYDMDNIDDGSAFEIGFMRALHKPVILVPFTNDPNKEKEMNLLNVNQLGGREVLLLDRERRAKIELCILYFILSFSLSLSLSLSLSKMQCHASTHQLTNSE